MKTIKGNKLHFTLQIFRQLWKIFFGFLQFMVAFAPEERRPRYTVIKAQVLHDEGLITDQEYMRSLHDRE